MELRDSPVVRPLFFTAWLIEAVSVVFEIVPISRIEPLLATFPATTFPTEQSTLLPGSGTLLRQRRHCLCAVELLRGKILIGENNPANNSGSYLICRRSILRLR